MSLRENVCITICDQVITLCIQMDGSDVWLNHKFIEKSDIVEASLALVGSPQLNVRTVFQEGLRLISRI